MLKNLMKVVLAATLLVTHAAVKAEDIDLFAGPPVAADLPNVLIVIDNTANWSSAFAGEMAALASTVSGLEAGKFRLGFMMYTETGGANGSPDGAYVRAAVRTMDATNKELYQALVNSFTVVGDRTNNGKLGLAMSEVNRYFSGTTAYAGANKVKRDYRNNSVSGLTASNAVYGLSGNAFSSNGATTYQSPVTSACQKNFVIFISNGKSSSSSSDNTTAASHLSAAGGNTTAIPLSPNGYQDEIADEWARYLANKTSNSVVTYVIDVVPTVSGQYDLDYKALLQSMAAHGGGGYFNVGSAGASDLGAKVQAALGTILSQIQSENAAFASASLPVSVNTQGTYLNQVFIGMFRPEMLPRWSGNLKQYQFRADADADGNVVALRLVDKTNNQDAINSLNGFIDPCAQSWWSTGDAENPYWPSGYAGSCLLSGLTDVRLDAPDGEIVEKGAVSQRLRAVSGASGASARNVTTCSGCGDNSALAALGSGSGIPTDWVVADAAEQGHLVDWARGQNVDNEAVEGKDAEDNPIYKTYLATDMRPSVHGDVVHSRPLAIDYGGTTGVVVFYGSNDGMLRAVNGNKVDTAGNELWSFVAPEHYGKFKRLRSNSPLVSFPSVTGSPTPTAKDYFFDGPIGFYNNGSSKWIYPTMRRGGRMIYAFDVSTAPSSTQNPTLKWKRGCPNQDDDLGCSAGFSQIGQTWSEPKVVKVAGYGSGASPVLIMGGGYDTCEDQDVAVNTACTAPKGNRIFVLDANTGTLQAALATDKSVAADVTVVDSNNDGLVDVAYAADTGGNLYRINIGTAIPGSWTIDKLAALGCTGTSCGRKFLHAPEVVTGTDFNAVLLGSGNRERPLLTNQAVHVDNAFFMIKDDHSASPTVITTNVLVSIDPDVALTTTQQEALAQSTNKGWYLSFGSGNHDKEQVVTSAVVFAGVVYFSTHQPVTPTACGANLGTARGYAVNYLDASTPGGLERFSVFAGGGLPPSPVTGVVTLTLTDSDNNTVKNPDGTEVVANVPFIIGGGAPLPGPPGCGISGLSPCLVSVDPSPVRSRTYWYIQQ